LLASVVVAMSGLMIGVIAFVVSTVVFVFAFAIYSIAFPPTTAGDRLQKLTLANESDVSDLVSEREARAYEQMAARLGRLAQGEDEDAAELMRKKLVYAGYKSRRALSVTGRRGRRPGGWPAFGTGPSVRRAWAG
jgi:hypothetical protein